MIVSSIIGSCVGLMVFQMKKEYLRRTFAPIISDHISSGTASFQAVPPTGPEEEEEDDQLSTITELDDWFEEDALGLPSPTWRLQDEAATPLSPFAVPPPPRRSPDQEEPTHMALYFDPDTQEVKFQKEDPGLPPLPPKGGARRKDRRPRRTGVPLMGLSPPEASGDGCSITYF